MRRFIYCLSVALFATLLSGCSAASVIWGKDGAQVIESTETLVGALASGETPDNICSDSVADLGKSSDWSGLSAGEPEEYSAQSWEEQASLDPKWNINLEGLPDGAEAGSSVPGNVFYRESDDGLCVVDVVWSTVISVD